MTAVKKTMIYISPWLGVGFRVLTEAVRLLYWKEAFSGGGLWGKKLITGHAPQKTSSSIITLQFLGISQYIFALDKEQVDFLGPVSGNFIGQQQKRGEILEWVLR